MDLPIVMEELDIQLTIGACTFQVLEATIEEGMSVVGGATIEIASDEDIDFDPMVDERAALVVTAKGFPIRAFSMRLESAAFRGITNHRLRYELRLHPDLHFLRYRKNTRKFRDQTTEAIVSAILDESGVQHSWNNARACDSRPYTVEYRETDFEFVSRLLEFEGVYYTFDDDGTMQLGDASSSLPDVGTFELAETEGATAHEAPGMTSFALCGKTTSGSATVSDYNWKKPDLSLLSGAAAQRDADLEVYDYPVGYREPSQGQVLAKLRMEAQTKERTYAHGTSSVVEFRGGRGFNFSHAEAIDFSGRYMLTHVVHRFATKWARDGKGEYSNRWRAIPAAAPFRPLVTTPHPVIMGNHTAMVRGPIGEEIHTDTFGRAKVQFHWDREAKGTDEDSRWIRTLQEISSSIVLSRVGWELAVSYIDGDPDRPVGISRQINGQMIPTYGQPSLKNRMTIKTETYPGKQGFNELRMDDSAGKMVMDWHSQHDFFNSVQDSKTEKIGNDQTHLIKASHSRTIGGDQTLEIGNDEVKQVNEAFKERVRGDRTEDIGGEEKIQAARTVTLAVNGDSTETIASTRTTFVGSVNIDIPPPAKLMKQLVGGKSGGLPGEGGGGGGGGGGLGGALGQLAKGLSAAKAVKDLVDKAKKPAGESQPCEYVTEAAQREFPASKDVMSAANGVLGKPGNMPDMASAMQSLVPSIAKLLGKGGQGGGDEGDGGGDEEQPQEPEENEPPQDQGEEPGGGDEEGDDDGGDEEGSEASAESFKGQINKAINKSYTMLVGGDYTKIANGQIQNVANEHLIEVVGGLKLTAALEENITQACAGRFTRLVAGNVTRKAKGAITHSAKESKIEISADMNLESEKQFEVRGKEIELTAKEKFRLETSGLAIELTPSCIKIEGSIKLDASGRIIVKGSPDKLSA